MSYNFDEKIQAILNKKFEPKIHAGYDPKDVDSYFDEVIEYLKEVKKLVDEELLSRKKIDEEISFLRKKNDDLEKVILAKEKQIQEYEEEGKTNVAILKRLDKLEKNNKN